MGKYVNLDEPLSKEDKEYLTSRGRGYLILANERRFGEDGKRVPEDHETKGASSQSIFYDNQTRQKAVYDTGGAPLPDTVLDYNTGRVADRENGVLVEYAGPGHTPGAYDPVFGAGEDEYGSDIDDDIADEVHALTDAALKKRLKDEDVTFDPKADREDLEDLLAIHLQDKRDSANPEPSE